MHNKNFGHLVLLQTLYAREFSPLHEKELLEVLHESVQENAPQMSGVSILEEMTLDIIKKLSLIDSVIEKLIPERDVNNILIIDKNILRIAIYEMVFSDKKETPIHVAIKEAMLLSKNFSMQIAAKVILRALTSLHEEIDPEDAHISKKERAEKDKVTPPAYFKAGALVYTYDNEGELFFALVLDKFGYWTFSKGGIEEGETGEETAARELKEEMDLDIEVLCFLGDHTYIANTKDEGRVKKQARYFLAFTENKPEITTETESGGLCDGRWFLPEEVMQLNMYKDIQRMVIPALEMIKEIESKK